MNTSFQLPNSPPSPLSLTVVCEKLHFLIELSSQLFLLIFSSQLLAKLLSFIFYASSPAIHSYVTAFQALIMCSEPTESVPEKITEVLPSVVTQ